MKEKLICIGGGTGPMAGVELHKKIIENTLTNGTDQDHLEVFHFSRSHDIGDRTEFLEGIIDENPAYGMYRTYEAAAEAASLEEKIPVIGIPCNTFHSPKIFHLFTDLIDDHEVNSVVLNMIEETGRFLREAFPDAEKLGLMTTTGTRKTSVYKKILNPLGFNILEVPESLQEELHDSIYNTEWGIKAVTPVSERSRENFLHYADVLTEHGVDAIILGCTEIPLALPEHELHGIPLVDPMSALARAFIREVDSEKLQPV